MLTEEVCCREQGMSEITIRKARLADLEPLVELLRLLFTIERDFQFHAPRQRLGLQMMLENKQGILLVAEKDAQVIGMCSGQLVISTAEGGFSLLVEDVVVEERWRGKGVGRELLRVLQSWAGKRKVKRFQLLADRSNVTGLNFYQRQGWQKTKFVCLCNRPVINQEVSILK